MGFFFLYYVMFWTWISFQIVSVNPTFQYRCAQDVSDEFVYFHPIDPKVREEARRQKKKKKNQKSIIVSHQHTREGIYQKDLGIINQAVMVTTHLPTHSPPCCH